MTISRWIENELAVEIRDQKLGHQQALSALLAEEARQRRAAAAREAKVQKLLMGISLAAMLGLIVFAVLLWR